MVQLMAQTIVCASVVGFNSTLDNDDNDAINTSEMLSREKRRDVWEDEEMEEEY